MNWCSFVLPQKSVQREAHYWKLNRAHAQNYQRFSWELLWLYCKHHSETFWFHTWTLAAPLVQFLLHQNQTPNYPNSRTLPSSLSCSAFHSFLGFLMSPHCLASSSFTILGAQGSSLEFLAAWNTDYPNTAERRYNAYHPACNLSCVLQTVSLETD